MAEKPGSTVDDNSTIPGPWLGGEARGETAVAVIDAGGCPDSDAEDREGEGCPFSEIESLGLTDAES